jgi:hypothetical protein
VFGVGNNKFAEMFYNFLSECTPLMHINIKTFLKKFKMFLPKKREEEDDVKN